MEKRIGVILTSLMLLVISCAQQPAVTVKEQLENRNLLGEHLLVRSEKFVGINGSVSGLFFGFSGTLKTETARQIYWCPKPGEIVPSTLPYSKFILIINEAKDTPTIEFVFDKTWLTEEKSNGYYDYSEESVPNLNDIVEKYYVQLVKIRISSATLAKEDYLPKINNQ